MKNFHPLQISAIRTLTPNSVAVSLDVPGELKQIFSFRAGQYITLKATIEGNEVRRAYSISSAPEEDQLTVGIKKVEDGIFSTFANDQLNVGDSIEVLPPEGRFIFEQGSGPVTIMAFAAGSGITPIMSIAKTVLAADPANQMVLIYGNRSAEETMFREEIKELEKEYTDRFHCVNVLSRSREEECLFGRIDRSVMNYALKNRFKDLDVDAFYLCGPKPMIDMVTEELTSQGISPEKIFFELFTIADEPIAEKPSENGTTNVTVVLDDEDYSFEMDRKTILLDAVLEADIDAPYSCQGGVCSTCIAKVTEGKAEMISNQILTDSEVADGLILTCQTKVLSPELKIDFDDV